MNAKHMTRSSKLTKRNALRMKELLFDLANMRDDGIQNFRRKWDRFYGQYPDSELLKFRDQLCAVWGGLTLDLNDLGTNEVELDSPLQNWEHVARFQMQELRQMGRQNLQEIILEHWLGQEKHWAVVEWKRSSKKVSANPQCLPATLTFCAIKYGDWLRICKNRGCQARYFVAVRKHQQYCTPDCAWPAKKAAKLKWWRAHREEIQAKQREKDSLVAELRQLGEPRQVIAEMKKAKKRHPSAAKKSYRRRK